MNNYNTVNSINWINFNTINKVIDVEYSDQVVLDTGESFPRANQRLTRSGQDYENFYHIQVNYDGQIVALGDLIASLTVTEIQKVKPDFALE